MKTKNDKFRLFVLVLQIAAITAYYIPPLFMSGGVGNFWLVAGVIQTAMFCTAFFRDVKKRRAIGVILTVLNIMWILVILLMGIIFSQLRAVLGGGALISMFAYGICALFAAIFAIFSPRKYYELPQEATM